MHISPTLNDAWNVEAELVSSGDRPVVEVRLRNALIGALPPISITLEAEPTMSKADYEAQALIMLAEAAADLESACIRESVQKDR